jgi:tetratricopeptide (TPR) repeat protein
VSARVFVRPFAAGLILFAAVCWSVPSACAQARRKKSSPPPAAAAGASDAERTQQGIGLYQQGRYAEAETTLRGVAGPEAAAYLAASLVKLKRHVEAEPPGIASLTADPGNPVAAAALGEALVTQKKHDDAINRLSGVLAIRNDVAYAYYWRGHAYYGKKMPDKMVSDFNAFLTLAPNAPEAQTVRSLLASLR